MFTNNTLALDNGVCLASSMYTFCTKISDNKDSSQTESLNQTINFKVIFITKKHQF